MAAVEGGKNLPEYTYHDLRLHRTEDDAWLAIDGKVYDVTQFLKVRRRA